MVNLWDTLVQCSRLEATRSYSSAALGNRSCKSLGELEMEQGQRLKINTARKIKSRTTGRISAGV